MTAAEILRSAEPPADDELIEKAIAELDVKIWEWADALKSAHTQLRSAFAMRPPQRPSAALVDEVPVNLSAAAAAAHVPSPPPMPAEWTAPPSSIEKQWTPPPPPTAEEPWAPPAAPAWGPPSHGGHGISTGAAPSNKAGDGSSSSIWSQAPAAGQQPFQRTDGAHAGAGQTGAGTMQWPSTPASNWPDAGAAASNAGSQAWPTWTPADAAGASTSGGQARKPAGGSVRATKAPKAVRPVLEGPTAEERAQKAAAEEALLSELEETIARRVRLLRRLDPDTAIEKLIDKAKQGHAEAQAAGPAKEDKSSSSWWRRK